MANSGSESTSSNEENLQKKQKIKHCCENTDDKSGDYISSRQHPVRLLKGGHVVLVRNPLGIHCFLAQLTPGRGMSKIILVDVSVIDSDEGFDVKGLLTGNECLDVMVNNSVESISKLVKSEYIKDIIFLPRFCSFTKQNLQTYLIFIVIATPRRQQYCRLSHYDTHNILN